MPLAVLILVLGLLWGCGGAPPSPPATAVEGPGLLLSVAERLQLPPVPRDPPELLKSWSFDEELVRTGVLVGFSTGDGVEVVAGAGRTGGALRVTAAPEARSSTVRLGVPNDRRRCTVRWAWRSEGPELPGASRARLSVTEEIRSKSPRSRYGRLGHHHSPPAPASGESWVEQSLSFFTGSRVRYLRIELEGPTAGEGAAAVLIDDVAVSCDSAAVTRYAKLPLVEGVDAGLPVRRVEMSRSERPAVLLRGNESWSVVVDRSQPMLLRTSVGFRAKLHDVCAVVRVDGEQRERRCMGGSGPRPGQWSELSMFLEPVPGAVSTVEFQAEADTEAESWVAWADPRLAPLERDAASAARRDVLLVFLHGLSEAALVDQSAELPTLRELRSQSTSYSRARTSSADPRAAAASILTGRTAGQHGARAEAKTGLRPEVGSLASELRAVGYSTALFASTHALETGLSRGFSWVHRSAGRDQKTAWGQGQSDKRVVQAFLEHWNTERDRSRPRFAVVELSLAAAPYHVPRADAALERFGLSLEALPEGAQSAYRGGKGLSVALPGRNWSPPPELLALGRQADWQRVDGMLAELLAEVPPEAIVAIVGLRGEAPDSQKARRLDEAVVHVPLLLRDPGAGEPGATVPRPVQTTQLADHLRMRLGLSGSLLPGPEEVDRDPPLQTVVYAEGGGRLLAVVQEDRWKVVSDLPAFLVEKQRFRPRHLRFYDLRASTAEPVPDLPEELQAALERALHESIARELPGHHLHCPAGHEALTVPWELPPKWVSPLQVASKVRSDASGLLLPPSPEAETVVLFPFDSVLTPPEGCTLRTVPPGPPAP